MTALPPHLARACDSAAARAASFATPTIRHSDDPLSPAGEDCRNALYQAAVEASLDAKVRDLMMLLSAPRRDDIIAPIVALLLASRNVDLEAFHEAEEALTDAIENMRPIPSRDWKADTTDFLADVRRIAQSA